MLRGEALAAVFAALIASASAQSSAGTATEAKAMLDRAAAAVRANKGNAFALFNADKSEFRDRDLYVFCFNASNGIVVAGPAEVRGMDARELHDESGKAYGREMLERAKEGVFVLVEHLFPRPGSEQHVRKHSFVTRVADHVCGVGHYAR